MPSTEPKRYRHVPDLHADPRAILVLDEKGHRDPESELVCERCGGDASDRRSAGPQVTDVAEAASGSRESDAASETRL